MGRDAARPAYDPAGHDGALREALLDVRAGRWMSMRALLEQPMPWWQWTGRTQVLAAAAAGTDGLRSFSHRARTRQLGYLPEEHLGKPVVA
ncbi:hypothetical protein ACWDTB_37580, partial [Streptomyces sp. NPDC003487]